MRLLAAAAVLLLVSVAPGQGQEKQSPSWMKIDSGAKKVEFDVVAGSNANNNNWNFNGYYQGNATVVVPTAWNVRISFANRDGNYPHSLVVIEDTGDPETYPEKAGREDVAIPRAYSKSPLQGISEREEDVISFKASKPGNYLWYCGVPAHGLSGMWIKFQVRDGAEVPYLLVAEDAEPGRE